MYILQLLIGDELTAMINLVTFRRSIILAGPHAATPLT